MPSNLIKSYAEKTGLSESEVEEKWNSAKDIVKREYPDKKEGSEGYYALITSIFKKMLKSKNEDANAVNTTSTTIGEKGIFAPKIGDMFKRIDKKIKKKKFEEGTFLDKIDMILEDDYPKIDKTILNSLAKEFKGKISGKEVSFNYKGNDYIIKMNDIDKFSLYNIITKKHVDFKAKNLESIYDQIQMIS